MIFQCEGFLKTNPFFGEIHFHILKNSFSCFWGKFFGEKIFPKPLKKPNGDLGFCGFIGLGRGLGFFRFIRLEGFGVFKDILVVLEIGWGFLVILLGLQFVRPLSGFLWEML